MTSGFYIRSLRPDVIHCCFVVPPFAGGVPIVTTIHDLGFVFRKEHYPPLLSARLAAALHRAVRRSNLLVAVSSNTRKDLLAATRARSDQIEMIYNGLDERFTPDSSQKDRKAVLDRYGIHSPYLLYAGKLEPRKNVSALIVAYERLRSTGKFTGQLVLIGSNRTFMWEKTQRRIDRSVYRSDIVQTGFIPDSTRPVIYAGARALAFVSLYEGFGFPVVEAMASAVPVVCSNSTCLPEIVGDAAVLVNPEEPEGIASALDVVLNEETVRRRLIVKGLERVKTFTWEGSASRMLDVYRELACSSASRQPSQEVHQ